MTKLARQFFVALPATSAAAALAYKPSLIERGKNCRSLLRSRPLSNAQT